MSGVCESGEPTVWPRDGVDPAAPASSVQFGQERAKPVAVAGVAGTLDESSKVAMGGVQRRAFPVKSGLNESRQDERDRVTVRSGCDGRALKPHRGGRSASRTPPPRSTTVAVVAEDRVFFGALRSHRSGPLRVPMFFLRLLLLLLLLLLLRRLEGALLPQPAAPACALQL